MKGRIQLDSASYSDVHIACDADLVTIYRTNTEGLEMLLTLIRARLMPTDANTLVIEGFARKEGTGDPEQSEATHGDEYVFQSVVFTPEASAPNPIAAGEETAMWGQQSLN